MKVVYKAKPLLPISVVSVSSFRGRGIPPPLCFPLFWGLASFVLTLLCGLATVDGCVVLLASHLTLRHFIISFVCPEHRK